MEYIIVPWYHPLENKMLTRIEILGRKENLEMAEYVYEFLKYQTEMLWEKHKKIYGLKGITQKKSYILGLLEGVKKTMIPNIESMATTSVSKDLIVLNKDSLLKYLTYRYPKIRRSKRGGSVINPDTYKKGKEDGKNVRIHPAVRDHNGRIKLLGRN